jgi:hypothetical protein
VKSPSSNGSHTKRLPAYGWKGRFALLCGLALSLASGCASLGSPAKLPDPQESATAQEVRRGPSYKVLMANYTSSEPTVFNGTLTKPITVSQALEESGATQKYNGMTVDLARRVPETGDVLRLEIPWDSEAGAVTDEHFNYAIHPGDEILVRPANAGPVHKMFQVLGSGEK